MTKTFTFFSLSGETGKNYEIEITILYDPLINYL